MSTNGQTKGCKIGVFVCDCCMDCGQMAEAAKVVEFSTTLPCVTIVKEPACLCSEEGQQQIRQDIRLYQLNRVLVAACSPKTYQAGILEAASNAGLNPFYVAMVNIWGVERSVAINLMKATAARLARMEDVASRNKPVTPMAVVVAGDRTGIESARKIADDGYKVYLVVKHASSVGALARDDKMFPLPFNPGCADCWIGPESVIDACGHPNITLLTCNEFGSRVFLMENN